MSELIIKSIYFNIISKSAIHKVQKIEVFIIYYYYYHYY